MSVIVGRAFPMCAMAQAGATPRPLADAELGLTPDRPTGKVRPVVGECARPNTNPHGEPGCL